MVDAIGAAGGKPITKINELNVNWVKLTAEQILGYQHDGQEVPKEILKWAEEMAKISGAVDDVTYETAIADPSQNPVEDSESPTAAQQTRTSMQEDGVNLYGQVSAFKTMSADSESENMAMMAHMNSAIQQSDAKGAEAGNIAEETASKSTNIKAEYDKLIEKMKSDTGESLTRQEQTRLINLGQQLNKIGTSGQQNLQNISMQLESLDAVVNESFTTAKNGKDIGIETVDAGQDILGIDDTQRAGGREELSQGNDTQLQSQITKQALQKAINPSWGFLFSDKNARLGLEAVVQGISTIGTSNSTEGTGKIVEGSIGENNAKTEVGKVKVQNATLVEGKSTTKQKAAEGTSEENPEGKDAEEAAKQGEAFTLADKDLTSDPTEIIKRKERKGVV